MITPVNPAVRVWLVREREWPKGTEQDLFVLATSLNEALEIVGTTPYRAIIVAQELCPITQLPEDKWRVTPVTPSKP